MKIFFAGYPLCGDPSGNARDNPEAMVVSKTAERDKQVVNGAGWLYKKGFDRANLWTRITFVARKRHFKSGAESTQAAADYMLGYESDFHHPMTGTLKIVNPADTAGGTPRMVTMHNALISPPSFTVLGCVTTATYTVEGPYFDAPVDETNWLFALLSGGDVTMTGDISPDAHQMWKISGSDLTPDSTFATDPHFALSGSDILPTGA